jgi:hypothetical protein
MVTKERGGGQQQGVKGRGKGWNGVTEEKGKRLKRWYPVGENMGQASMKQGWARVTS